MYCYFHCKQLIISVQEASLRNNGFLKPNPYVELLIDNKSKRKTEVVKNTYLPKWNEEFTILVNNIQIIDSMQQLILLIVLDVFKMNIYSFLHWY